MTARLCVRQLSLIRFRSYDDFLLDLDGRSVVLYGPNGSGKTNILEALSLLAPGRGLRGARGSALQKRGASESWGIAAKLETPNGALQIGTGRDPAAPQNDSKRRVHIDGKSVRSQQALAGLVPMAWITPELDRVLTDSPAARRRLIDRLVFSFDPAHAGRVQRYEKAMRERLRLLREGSGEAAWYDALESEMATSGVAIAAARRQLVAQLRRAMEEGDDAFPKADLRLLGLAEEALDEAPALLVEDRLREALARRRADDAASGVTGAGPHRSDLDVIHRGRGVSVDLCSTGEQKALLIAVMLSFVRVLKQSAAMPPLLLLDDIAAHLDAGRRSALFDAVDQLGVQAWLTGTDQELFTAFLARVQPIKVQSM